MFVGEDVSQELFVLNFDLGFDSDYPKFTTGKMYHIIQNVCKSYTGNFTVKRLEGGVAFENGEFKEQDKVVIKLSGVTAQEADMIAVDICSFLSLNAVYVSREISVSHKVIEKLET